MPYVLCIWFDGNAKLTDPTAVYGDAGVGPLRKMLIDVAAVRSELTISRSPACRICTIDPGRFVFRYVPASSATPSLSVSVSRSSFPVEM